MFLCFFCLTSLSLESSRIRKTALFLMSCRLKKYKNLHLGASQMVQKHKHWKLQLVESKLRVFISYLSQMKAYSKVYSVILYSSTLYSLSLPFFVLEIFKFKYDRFFIRHSVSISKFEWSEQPCFSTGITLLLTCKML